MIDRSRVAQPGVPEPEPPGPPEADAPPGDDGCADEGAVVCELTAWGVCDAGAEEAGEDAAVPVCPLVVAGVGDDPVDAVQPAAAATAATAVTIPAARSSSEP